MNSTLQVRIDKKEKRDAQKVFERMGLDMSSGIKLFLRHIINTETLPFVPRTENGFTPEQEAEILKEIEATELHGKSYNTAEELHKDILAEE